MPSIPQELAFLVRERFGLQGPAIRVAAGVSGSALWRIDSPKRVLVRVSEHYNRQHLAGACEAVARPGQALPEVVAPLVADDGNYVFLWNGRPVTVWPYVAGTTLDRHNHRQLIRAAQLLARLHQVPAGPKRVDATDDIPGADNAAAAATLLPDPTLDEWLAAWRGRGARTQRPGWRHGDFFCENILCRDGEIVGLIDWDDISIGDTDVELAWAMWEFAKSPRGDRLVPQTAEVFLTAYQQAGARHVPLDDLIPLTRERLRRDVAFFRRIATSHGHALNVADEASKIDAFRALTEI